LRNHGVVTAGETIEEALYLMHNVVSACESQIKLMVVGIENMQMLSEESIKQVRSIIKSAGLQVQGKPDDSNDKEQKTDEAKARKWKIWDLEFEARMRMLDNAVRCDATSICPFSLSSNICTLFPYDIESRKR
jgi:adducin